MLLAGISRTQHSGIPGYGRNLQNLRNSGVTAGRNIVIYNQGCACLPARGLLDEQADACLFAVVAGIAQGELSQVGV